MCLCLTVLLNGEIELNYETSQMLCCHISVKNSSVDLSGCRSACRIVGRRVVEIEEKSGRQYKSCLS